MLWDDGGETALGVMSSAEWTESEQDVTSSSCYLFHNHPGRLLLSEVYTDTESMISEDNMSPCYTTSTSTE